MSLAILYSADPFPSPATRLAGQTLFTRALQAARGADSVRRVLVAVADRSSLPSPLTGEGEIIETGRRPEESVDSWLRRTVDLAGVTPAEAGEWIAFLSMGAPGLESGDVEKAVAQLGEDRAELVTAVAALRETVRRSDGSPAAAGEPLFRETGALRVARAAGWLAGKEVGPEETVLLEIPAARANVIRCPEDLAVMEGVCRRLQNAGKRALLPKKPTGLVFDFDGVFTDNGVIVNQEGVESVACSRGDGMGFDLLRKTGLPMIVLSKEPNPVVAARCRKLKLECVQGLNTKIGHLRDWMERHGLRKEEVVYLGNDVNDLECMAEVGCPVAVGDAHPKALAAARIVLENHGGKGAIRELADLVIDRLEQAG